MVVGSKVKAYIKSKGMKSSGDVIDGLNKAVKMLLDHAAMRAKSNKRSTVRSTDV